MKPNYLENIPNDWEIKKIKYISETIIGITYSPSEVVEKNEGLLVLRSSNIQNARLTLIDNVYVKKDVQERQILKVGDILLCSRNGSVHLIGKNILIDERTAGQTFGAFMTVARSKYYIFLYWFFNSSIFKSQSGLFSTSTVNQLTNDILNNMEIAFPPLSTQQKIANFLDQKTSEIDTLIKKKKKLIKLLQEEEKAFINEKLTDTEGKWEKKKLKYLADIGTGGKNTDDREAEGIYPFFVRSQTIEKISTYSFDGEAILTAGDGVGVGKVFHYCNGKFDFHQRVYKVSNFKEVIGIYFFYFMKSFFYRDVLSWNAKSTVDSLRLNMLQDFKVSYPFTIAEQEKIVQEIETHLDKNRQLLEKLSKEVDLLKEYRQSLISEAVTGQLVI